MKIQGSIALVTGANRGLGLAFVRGLLAKGAYKVYAAARDLGTLGELVGEHGVVPLKLDVTSPDDIAAAARIAGDVTLVINNAGIARPGSILGADAVASLEAEIATNVVGPLRISRAFAPILARSPHASALVNVLSVLSWVSSPPIATYAASKSAAWAMTNGVRAELRAQHTQVVGVHVGYMDTDLAKGVTEPKTAPADVVARVLAGIEAGSEEVLADDLSAQVKLGLAAQPGVYLSPRAR